MRIFGEEKHWLINFCPLYREGLHFRVVWKQTKILYVVLFACKYLQNSIDGILDSILVHFTYCNNKDGHKRENPKHEYKNKILVEFWQEGQHLAVFSLLVCR